jgi:hypothetical protein
MQQNMINNSKIWEIIMSRFEKLFEKAINEAPKLSTQVGTNQQPIPISDEGQELHNDLNATSNLTNPAIEVRQVVNSKMNKWIMQCERLSTEINGTDAKSWVNSLKTAYPENATKIVGQLGKTSGALLQVLNDLRTLVNMPEEKQKI